MMSSPIRTADVAASGPDPFADLAAGLGAGPFALIVLFVSPDADLGVLEAGLAHHFGADAPIIGCTTAGEIHQGYREGRILAFGLLASDFAASPLRIENLATLQRDEIRRALRDAQDALAQAQPEWAHTSAVLLVDGLTYCEDALTAILASGLGPVPLVGGSAGDGGRFKATFVLHEGRFRQGIAVVTLIRSRGPVRAFTSAQRVPSRKRMVVTKADPDKRLVIEINASPAAQEYCRLLGHSLTGLSVATFAAHPMVLRVGGGYHIRSVREILPDGSLQLYSSLGEGYVLSLAAAEDIEAKLEDCLGALSADAPPIGILAFDCTLRRMEAEATGLAPKISAVLAKYGVCGFSSYGEQVNAMHVNQAMTGIAFYAADAPPQSNLRAVTP